MILLESTHIPGRHCGSSALRDLVNYHGLAWDEALCFGLGAGLGIWYLADIRDAPSRLVHVRAHDLEARFFEHIGQEFSWRTFSTPEEGEQALQECLFEGRPALIQTDIYYLPYFHSKTHFPGHALMVWGYDEQSITYLVSDTERSGLIAVAARDLTASRFVPGGFFPLHGNMFAPDRLFSPRDLPAVMRQAIVRNSRVLSDLSLDYQGLAALVTWEQDLDNWPHLDDWRWTARFAYQVIERRGTGGSGFRLIYKEFLEQAQGFLPEIADLGLVDLMADCAKSWRDLAFALKKASEQENADFAELKVLLSIVRKREKRYHEQALQLASGSLSGVYKDTGVGDGC